MTVPSWARKGVKVACIEAIVGSRQGEIMPRVGETYTIRSVHVDYRGVVGIRLREIINAPRKYHDDFCEAKFVVGHFRPLVEPKTEAEDVALFTEHLKATPPLSTTRKARADA